MMHPSRLLCCLVLVVCMTGRAGAAAPEPATGPAVSLDQSTPKALLRSFYVSRGEVDEAAMRSLFHAADPLEQKVLEAVVQVELANARLREAKREKFGGASLASSTTGPADAPPSTAPLSSPGAPAQSLDVDTVQEIDSLTEKIEGDRAILVSPTDPKVKMEFVRVEGKWKLPVAAYAGVPIDAGVAETLSAATRAQVEVIDSLAADVKAGKFSGEDEVRRELARRLAERIASATRPAASQSSTQPAGT